MGAGASVLNGPDGVSSSTMPAGNYVLSETGPTGYVLDGISCSGAVFDAATATLSLEPMDSASCVFINNDSVTAPATTSLTLVKTVVNDNGGDGVITDFDISINGVEVVSGASTVVAAGVDIVISELELPAYRAGNWSCVDNSGLTSSLPVAGPANGTTVNLSSGANVVCSIENNDLGVDLSVKKSASTQSPSVGEVIGFDLLVSNAGPDDATDVIIKDVLPAGFAYVVGSISGGDSSDDTDPVGAGLQWTINSLLVGTSVNLSFQASVLAL